jgi:hypothetical protein
LKFRHAIFATLILVGLTACEPKERALWSPDGRSAAVLIGHQLFFTDEAGRLTGSLESSDGDPGKLLVEKMAWSADGRSLLIHRVRLIPTWEELSPLLPVAESERVTALAAKMPDLLRSAALLHRDADRADQLIAKIAGTEQEAILNALRLAFVNDRAALEEALTDAPKARASLATASDEAKGFFLHELALVEVGGHGGKPVAKTIVRGLRGPASLQLSPAFPVVAAGFFRSGEKVHDLEIIALDGSARETIATESSGAFAWTPDGRSLVSLAPVAGGGGPLMRLIRHEVLDVSGVIDPGKGNELAIAVVPFAPRLAVLPGGEILFASQPGSLPMPAGGTEQPRLYLVSAEGGAIRAVPTAEGALPMDLGYFVASPDGKRVAVVESGTDAVAVVDLASGASELVSAPHPGLKCRTLPSWKSPDELSYAALNPATGRIRWLLWKSGGEKSLELSEDWPTGSTDDWLEKSESPTIHAP